MTTVTCVGIAVQDLIFSLQTLPTGPGKYHASTRTEVGGGVAANAAVAVSRLGGHSRYVGALGEDHFGEAIVRDLNAAGVDTDRVRRVNGLASPLSSIAVGPRGERLIVNHSDSKLFDQARAIEDSDLEGSDAVLVDVRWPKGAEAALKWAAGHGVPGVVDYDVGNRPCQFLLPLASHVVFSADALRDLTGAAKLDDGLRIVGEGTSAWLGVTEGEEGTYWMEDHAFMQQPAFEVPAVDTTGAGDVYHGALALILSQGTDDIRNAIKFASAAAAITCTIFGGRNGIPTGDEVHAFLAERS